MSFPRFARIDSDVCGVPGCGFVRSRNRSQWCTAHRSRRSRHGDVQADVPVRRRVLRRPAVSAPKNFDLEDTAEL